MNFICIALGGFIGAVSRYLISNLIPSSNFPLSTFIINITGSLVIGFVLLLSYERWSATPQFRLFLAIGLLGAFTTFSTYAVETLDLINQGRVLLAFSYYVGSIVAGVLAVILGSQIAKYTLHYFEKKDYEEGDLEEGGQN